VLTGANLANRDLLYLGVSGDGDSASIGLGQFAHAMRRGVRMAYIVENNGVYGLTKGQFSATADSGSKSKKGVINSDSPVDLVAMALQLGATYVGRSFSGNKEQLVPLIKGAMAHGGAAFIDVISPCVAFNNHPGSTKSYDYVREHNEAVSRIDFISAARGDHGRRWRRARWWTCASTTARCCACAACTPTTTRPTATPPWPSCSAPGARRGRDRPAVRRPAGHRPAHGAEHDRSSAECAGCAKSCVPARRRWSGSTQRSARNQGPQFTFRGGPWPNAPSSSRSREARPEPGPARQRLGSGLRHDARQLRQRPGDGAARQPAGHPDRARPDDARAGPALDPKKTPVREVMTPTRSACRRRPRCPTRC
jgi:hypothetical protein